MAEARFGTFEDLMAAAVPEMRPIARRLREIIAEIDPEAVEVVRLGDGAATYGLGPKKMSEGYAYIMPYKQWVNLGFYMGATLPDPAAIMEGTGKKLRHVKVRSVEDAGRPAIRALIEAALAERNQALGRA
jgi:hypothetical protein